MVPGLIVLKALLYFGVAVILVKPPMTLFGSSPLVSSAPRAAGASSNKSTLRLLRPRAERPAGHFLGVAKVSLLAFLYFTKLVDCRINNVIATLLSV